MTKNTASGLCLGPWKERNDDKSFNSVFVAFRAMFNSLKPPNWLRQRGRKNIVRECSESRHRRVKTPTLTSPEKRPTRKPTSLLWILAGNRTTIFRTGQLKSAKRKCLPFPDQTWRQKCRPPNPSKGSTLAIKRRRRNRLIPTLKRHRRSSTCRRPGVTVLKFFVFVSDVEAE